MMRTHACNSDSDPDSERDEDTPAGALALPPKLCSGREVFCTTRNVAYHPSLRNERPHIFDAALPHKSRIHPDWAESVNPALLETHIGPLLGDKTTLRDPGRSNAKIWRPSSHISVACQNVTGSSQPYGRAGWPNDDCRFAAWTTLVNKGVFHLVFLVDAHCSVSDVKQCSRYAKASDSGHSRVYGAPTTARASRNILDDNDARPEAHRIRSGGILAIAHPTFSAGIQSTTHLCSGRMLVIEHACATYAAVYGVSSANHPPHRATAATELASAVAHLVHAATKDHTPLIISGDVNAALAPIDRLDGTLQPYDTNDTYSLPRVLTRLGMTDLYRAKFPDAPHYTWSGTNGKGQSRSRIDAFWVNDAAIAMAGGLASMLTAMGSHPGSLGTDHSPIFARFAARMDEASTSGEPGRDKPRRHAPPSAPRVYSTQPKGPTQWKLSPRQTKRYSQALDHLHDDPRFASVLAERATFETARHLYRADAHAADMLGITGVVTHDLIAARLRQVTMHDCPEVVEALRHLSRSTMTGPVDVTTAREEYCESSSVWYKSLARALTQAEGYARHGDSARPPRRRHCTKPPEMLQVEAAMSIIDHWAEVSPHPVDTWHDGNTWNCVSRSLTSIMTLNTAHGFGPQTPSVHHGPPANGPTWHEWITAHLPHITHVATRKGMLKVGRRWIAHAMDDNTRAKLGHSLDGELRRDSSDYLDAILIPTSQVTGAADVSAPLTWTSDDSNMRTHMQLVTQRLSSDKTRTTTNDESDADVQTYVFTREAMAFLTTHDDDLNVVRPATFEEAASRIKETNIRLRKARGALQGSIDEQPQSDWEWSPSPTAQTRRNMRVIVEHARNVIGITVPPGVAAMYELIHHSKAIRSAAKIMRAPPGPGTTHAAMITEMLDGNFPPIPSINSDVSDLVPDAMRGMKAAWDMWAKSAVSELDRVLSQTHIYGTSLVRALQPKHTEDEGVRNGFAQCVRNFADVTELRSALLRMKASSTGGLCGVTREHFSNAPDHVLEWVLELTEDVFDGISPTALKLGAVTPLPKDDTRFRPITLLEP